MGSGRSSFKSLGLPYVAGTGEIREGDCHLHPSDRAGLASFITAPSMGRPVGVAQPGGASDSLGSCRELTAALLGYPEVRGSNPRPDTLDIAPSSHWRKAAHCNKRCYTRRNTPRDGAADRWRRGFGFVPTASRGGDFECLTAGDRRCRDE